MPSPIGTKVRKDAWPASVHATNTKTTPAGVVRLDMQKLLLVLVLLIFAAAIFGGYAGFIFFLTRVLPETSLYGLILVAVVAGVAGFFNPCAFPLLPAYLGGFLLEGVKKPGGAIFRSGLSSALGVITFNIILGAVLAILGAGFGASFGITGPESNVYVRGLRIVVGAFLVYLGLSHAAGRGNPFSFLGRFWSHPKLPQNQGSNFGKFYSYGFGYTLLGIGCGGPILGSLAIFALSSGGFLSVLLSFSIYTFTMAALMVFTSILIGFSEVSLIARLRASVVTIQRISGVLIFLVGVYLIISSIFVREFARLFFP